MDIAFNFKPKAYWSTDNEVILEEKTLKLRHFPNEGVEAKRPVLILPPQAGHHANIADYAPDQSLVKVFHKYGFDVYVTEWLSATKEYKDLGIDDYLMLTDAAVEEIRKRTGVFKIHLVGQCQGGWQAAAYTSLFQEKIASLVVAAAPIDLEAAHSDMNDYAKLPMSFFELLVMKGQGVLDGKNILRGFKNMQPEEHYVNKYKRLWELIDKEDDDNLSRFLRFENWYEYTQNLPGRFYLEIIEKIFKENGLIKPGTLKADGRAVNLKNITCPIILMAGKKDHITPINQCFALKYYVSTPSEDIIEILTEGGHIGTLMGNESLRMHWTTVNEMLLEII